MFLVMMMFAGVFWGFIEVRYHTQPFLITMIQQFFSLTISTMKTIMIISTEDILIFTNQAFLFWFLDDLGAKKLDMGWTVRL